MMIMTMTMTMAMMMMMMMVMMMMMMMTMMMMMMVTDILSIGVGYPCCSLSRVLQPSSYTGSWLSCAPLRI